MSSPFAVAQLSGTRLADWTPSNRPKAEPRPSVEAAHQRRTAIAVAVAVATNEAPTPSEGTDMSDAAAKIKAALKDIAPASAGAIVKATGLKGHAVKSALKHLLGADEIASAGQRAGTRYGLPGEKFAAKTPAKNGEAKSKPKKKAKAARVSRPAAARPAPARATRTPATPPGAISAYYAINHLGELGLQKGETKLSLAPTEFAELREFISNAAAIWQTE